MKANHIFVMFIALFSFALFSGCSAKSPKELCEANEKEENMELCVKMMEGIKEEIGEDKWNDFSKCVDGNTGDEEKMKGCFEEAGIK